MRRVLEPELMEDVAQACAYARADFASVNQGFVDRFVAAFPALRSERVLDLGCGPGDIAIRLARALPSSRVIAVDGAAAMIRLAKTAVANAGLTERIALRCERVQELRLAPPADAVVSNSLLHHLAEPLDLWTQLRRLARPGAPVLVMDLLRPTSAESAHALVDRYAAGEPEVLRRDFFNSLLAAFRADEVEAQIGRAELSGLRIELPDDRHWIATGRL